MHFHQILSIVSSVAVGVYLGLVLYTAVPPQLVGQIVTAGLVSPEEVQTGFSAERPPGDWVILGSLAFKDCVQACATRNDGGMAVQKKGGVMSCLCSASFDVSKLKRAVPDKEDYYQVFDIKDVDVGRIHLFSYAGEVDIEAKRLVNGYKQYAAQSKGKNKQVIHHCRW